MSYETIILEKKDHIAVLTLNRPERLNAVTSQMRQELLSALDDVDGDDEMRVLVFTGAGRAFCAGADVQRMAGGGEKEDESGAVEEMRQKLAGGSGILGLRLQKMQKPTIAMVNGVAAGGGFGLALACDLRVGSENARFMDAFTRIGLYSAWGITWFAPRVMGLPKALEYLFTGDFIEAKEAEKLGLLNHLVPADKLESETMALARKIANGPPLAIRLTKVGVYRGLGIDLELDLQATEYEDITLHSEDHKEGIAAFREKRPPVFRGK